MNSKVENHQFKIKLTKPWWQKPPGKTQHENQCQHTQGSETMGGRVCIRAQFPDRQQTEEVQKHMGVMPPQTTTK